MTGREVRDTGVTQARGWIQAGTEARGKEGPELLLHRECEGPRGPPACLPRPWVGLLGSVCRAVGEELGLVGGSGIWILCLLIEFEEHLLLPLLLVQIFFQSLGHREHRSEL